eukprot:GCRY01002558.1.p1 GENE.GCRY01002558.1~~GCRY01002558.1.p1  ORF type:complete len:522 (-),score=96.81 GCRY01002558.1:344-1909(-)
MSKMVVSSLRRTSLLLIALFFLFCLTVLSSNRGFLENPHNSFHPASFEEEEELKTIDDKGNFEGADQHPHEQKEGLKEEDEEKNDDILQQYTEGGGGQQKSTEKEDASNENNNPPSAVIDVNGNVVLSNYSGNAQNPRIGILIVVTNHIRKRITPNINVWRCYAARHNYSLYIVDPDAFPDCLGTRHFFFHRHCITLKFLPQVDWLFFADGDTIIADMNRSLEDFIDDSYYVIHAMREHCGEVQAGTYLLRNTPQAYTYIQDWIDGYMPSEGYTNTDNGVLHLHLVKHLRPESYEECRAAYDASAVHALYDVYVGCCLRAIGAQREYPEKGIKILRRYHTFSRDWKWVAGLLPTDFVLHGIKNPGAVIPDFEWTTREAWERCIDPAFQLTIANATVLSPSDAQARIRQLDFHFAIWKQSSIGFPDIYRCWPHCATNLIEDPPAKVAGGGMGKEEIPRGAVESWGENCWLICRFTKGTPPSPCPTEDCTAIITDHANAKALEKHCNRFGGSMDLLSCDGIGG